MIYSRKISNSNIYIITNYQKRVKNFEYRNANAILDVDSIRIEACFWILNIHDFFLLTLRSIARTQKLRSDWRSIGLLWDLSIISTYFPIAASHLQSVIRLFVRVSRQFPVIRDGYLVCVNISLGAMYAQHQMWWGQGWIPHLRWYFSEWSSSHWWALSTSKLSCATNPIFDQICISHKMILDWPDQMSLVRRYFSSTTKL